MRVLHHPKSTSGKARIETELLSDENSHCDGQFIANTRIDITYIGSALPKLKKIAFLVS